jgi:hypothetical protein
MDRVISPTTFALTKIETDNRFARKMNRFAKRMMATRQIKPVPRLGGAVYHMPLTIVEESYKPNILVLTIELTDYSFMEACVSPCSIFTQHSNPSLFAVRKKSS